MKKLFLFIILLFSFSIVNAKGVQTKKYNHIVSLTLSGDEMLFGLVSENRIAGLSGKINEDKEISNIVDKAKKFPKVEANEEVLISLEPDLIIVADWLSKKTNHLSELTGAKVYIYKTANSYEEQKKLIRDLANLVEEKENGEKLIANMDNRLKALQNKIAKKYKGAKPRILMYTTFGSTSGKNTTFDDMVKLINGVNVVSEAGINKFQDISKEKIIELNPDIIIVPIAKKYDNVAKVSKLFFEDPSFKNVKAINNKKVYFIQYKDITATSQYMIDNIENLAKVVYQFKE
ncbi:ABC transporter substrate-binding protein [Fusobacterium periodonticum]|uniref:ABC transporter substrate-binding protein n=1 Tax=Fusobacterium periodonticum TaxID=860 RepID=UPI0028D8A79A|nr:ABC transporter substrate-binding protein [Fusobacterium periodonticum]